jgi:hypothetical protein
MPFHRLSVCNKAVSAACAHLSSSRMAWIGYQATVTADPCIHVQMLYSTDIQIPRDGK